MSTRRSARLSAAAETQVAAPTTIMTSKGQSTKGAATVSRKRKTTSSTTASTVASSAPGYAGDNSVGMAPPPTTPTKRRRVAPPAAPPVKLPPVTPTPSNAKLIGQPATWLPNAPPAPSPSPSKLKPKTVRRLADPGATHAQLVSPETSRVIRPGARTKQQHPDGESNLSPSKTPAVAAPAAGTLLEEACAHLIRVDERMRPLVEKNYCRVFSPEGLAEKIDPFEALCSGIISQQVSGAAAKSIKKRFIELFFPAESAAEAEAKEKEDAAAAAGRKSSPSSSSGIKATKEEDPTTSGPSSSSQPPRRAFPTPSQVCACPLDRLRTAGLSQRKAEYVSGLAEKFVSGDLSAQLLADAPYDEVLERLTSVRGLGRWSAEMFACFALKRADVFSLGDLGVQRGMAAFVGRDVAKLKGSKGGKWKYMSEADMTELSARFAPYRSLFMWYMWRVEETDVSTME